MKLNIPRFDIQTSGISDSLNKLTREFEDSSARLNRGLTASERNVEAEREIRRTGNIIGFAGRAILGGVSIGSALSTANNELVANQWVNEAQNEYEEAFVAFDDMTLAEKNTFLNEGGFEKIHDKLMDKLDEDLYGVDMRKKKERWNAQFRANYMRLRISVQKELRKEQEARLDSLRAEFRNKIIAEPYNPDAQNGKLAADFRNRMDGLVDTIEEADSIQTYDQIYGLLTGFYNNEDHEGMTSLLKMDITKEILGDEYDKQIKLRDKLKRRKEKEGDTKFKISGFNDAIDLFKMNFDTGQMRDILDAEGFGSLGNELTNTLRNFVKNQNNESVDGIDLSELHKHIPNRANRSQQVKIHTKLLELAEKIQKRFEDDPVDTYMRIMSDDKSPYIQPAERGLIYENTGRILTNKEVTNDANLLVNAFAKSFKEFELAQESLMRTNGIRGMREIYAMIPEIMKGTSEQKKNFLKIIQLHSLPEVTKQIPLPEARDAVARGVTPPTAIELRGMGDAHDKSWSNNEDLMDVIKILAMHRTLGDKKVREGQGKVDSDVFATKYWKNLNELVEDYDSNFDNITEGTFYDSEGKGRGETHLAHLSAVGKSIDEDGYQQSTETFENNLNPQYFERYGRNIFSEETLELLRREDVKVEADIHNGNYQFYVSVPRGEEATPLSYEIRKKNGERFKLPVHVMYTAKGKIFQNIPHFDIRAFDNTLPESPTEDIHPGDTDNLGDNEFARSEIGQRISKGGVFSKIQRAVRQPDVSIPSAVLQPIMLKLMFRESRFDSKAVEPNVKGRNPGRGILQLTSPHLLKGVDPHDNAQAINVGTKEINRLYEEGLRLAKEYNQERIKEGDVPLDFTHGDVMMYAIKAWNGGGIDSPRGFNVNTIVRAYEGRLSDTGSANNFASSVLYGLMTLSPEEEALVNKKENDEFFESFPYKGHKPVMEWMDAPITPAATSVTREPAGIQVPFMLGALLNATTFYAFKELFQEKPENYQEWLERNGLPHNMSYKDAWEWHKSGKLKDKPPKGNKFEEWLKKVGLPLNTTNVEALKWYMNKKYGKREPSGLGAEKEKAGPVDIIKPAPNLTGV